MAKKSKIEQKSINWWAEMLRRGRVVFLSSEFPNNYQKRFLKKQGLAFPIKRGLWLLKKEQEKPKEQFLIYYWEIISKVLSRYNDWSIRGKTAINLLLGKQNIPKEIKVRISDKVIHTIELKFGFKIFVNHDSRFNSDLVQKVELSGSDIFVDIPERLLLEYKNKDQSFVRLIKSQSFDKRIIDTLYQEKPTPKSFKRVIQTLNQHKRFDFVKDFKEIVKRYTHYHVPKIKSVKTNNDIYNKNISPDKPWVIRQKEQVKGFSNDIEEKFKLKIKDIPKYNLDHLLNQARDSKQYDIYHSTTIEGYQITPEEVSEVLLKYKDKKEMKGGIKKRKELKNKMAILGYANAFDLILEKVKKDYPNPQVSNELIKDIFYQLFKPTADAGILDKMSLTRWRKTQNFIRSSRHIPPSPNKVPDLMEDFERSVQKISNPIIKSIISHWLFTSIHPYMDGNGRTARLLMNYIFLSSGYSWLTIKAEQREKYFNSLEKANIENDILPFSDFIVSLLLNL